MAERKQGKTLVVEYAETKDRPPFRGYASEAVAAKLVAKGVAKIIAEKKEDPKRDTEK